VENDKQQMSLVLGGEFPLSLDNAHALLVKAIYLGRVQPSEHFKRRVIERKFTTLDIERAIKCGKITRAPEYCEEYNNWVFRVEGLCFTRQFEARVALDWSEDLDNPLMIYITGIYKGDARWRGRTKKKK
jgi:hypothetical protein